MNIVVRKLILFLIIFTIIYVGYYILVIRKHNKEEQKQKKSKKNKELKDRIEIQFLINKYKIDLKQIDTNQLLWDIAFTNSFIMSFAVVIMGLDFIKGYIWQLLLGIVILIPLILIGYHILGKKYKKQEKRGNKNV